MMRDIQSKDPFPYGDALCVPLEEVTPEQVARAEDGCVPPAVEPELAYDVLNHYTVQFLIANFIDPAAAGPLVDVSDLITPLVDFRVTGDPFAAS